MSRRDLPALAVWATVVLICFVQEMLAAHWGGGPLTWRPILLIQSATWGTWGAVAVLVLPALWRRVARGQQAVVSRALLHVGAACLLGVVACGIGAFVAALHYYGFSIAAMRDMFRDRLHTALAGTVLAYGAVLLMRRRNLPQPPFDHLRRFVARRERSLLVIPAAHVDWLEADDDTVRLHVGQSVHMLRETLTSLAGRLDPRRFARIHRSTIVNLDRVTEIQPWFKGEHVLLLQDGTRLTIGPTYRDGFLERLAGDRER